MTLTRSMSAASYVNGLVLNGQPLVQKYSGDLIWVDSNGGGGNKGTFDAPCTTISAAHSLVTSNKGDIIMVKAGHAETLTSTTDFSKSGFAIVGYGFGDIRPTFTNGNTTATTDDLWDFAGDDIYLHNLYFKEASGLTGAGAVWINCSGDNFVVDNCYVELGGEALTFLTHDGDGGVETPKKNLQVRNCWVIGVAAGPDVVVRVETSHTNAVLADCFMDFSASTGLDTGCIVFVSGTTGSGGHLVANNYVLGLSASADGTDNCLILQSATPTYGGLAVDNKIVSGDATFALGTTPAGGFAFINNICTELGKGAPTTEDYAGTYPVGTSAAA